VAGRRITGKIVIISSPSGGGKTTICNRLLKRNRAWRFSISCTTREKRPDEVDGREYHFVSPAAFKRRREKNDFAEWAQVHRFLYATPRKPLEDALKSGATILLDVDVKGADSIKKEYPHALSIFILPPGKEDLRRRLKRRGTETKQQLAVRLQRAISEMKLYSRFDYVIINKDINEAVTAADHIIKSWTVGVTYFGRNKSRAYKVKVG
jgi:guanylate kinase